LTLRKIFEAQATAQHHTLDQPCAVIMQSARVQPEVRVLVIGSVAVWQLLSSESGTSHWAFDQAADIRSGIEKLRYKPYDVVVVELAVCSSDQSAVLQKLKHTSPAADVILLVEESTPQDVIGAIRSQAFGYFSKPFDPTAIRDMILSAASVEEPADAIELLSANPDYLTLRMRCSLFTVDRLVRFLTEIPIELSEDERREVGTAFREMLLNAIEHGGKFDSNEWVQVSRVRTRRTLVYHIVDPGEGFSRDSLHHAAVSHPDDPIAHVLVREQAGIRPGGFGMLIATSLIDEVIYNEHGNEVILIKHLI
jgi:DNA-binding response OmpR family regulator